MNMYNKYDRLRTPYTAIKWTQLIKPRNFPEEEKREFFLTKRQGQPVHFKYDNHTYICLKIIKFCFIEMCNFSRCIHSLAFLTV